MTSLDLEAGEELWVIARAARVGGSTGDSPADRTFPVLNTTRPGGKKVPLPLRHTDVSARLTGYIASVSVVQKYHNPYDEKIEAVYVFPLPQNAAVNEFLMTIGERHIRGIIREREEAEEIYREARRQGHVASLLTQERPNIFTQSVANIEPAASIDIELVYFNTLAARDGLYEFVFPTVVGPRFNPPGSAGGMGAVRRDGSGSTGQSVEVPYLAPGERSGHDISLAVDIAAGMPIEELYSPSHAIEKKKLSANHQRVTLSPLDRIPNRDFILRYRLAGKSIKTALLGHRDKRGGFFTLMIEAPAELGAVSRVPMEMIFVLDCSGSMNGEPIALAKSAAERALRRLGPDDTFQIIRFSSNASQLGPRPLAATQDNVDRGLAYIGGLRGGGGTMMIEGIKAALDFPHDPRRLRVVSFMTDGFIGNEVEILSEVKNRLGASRIFSFGVGSSPNRFLLERMAQLGRGAVAYVGLDEGSQRAVDAFYEQVSHPALTDVEIDWGATRVTEVYPSRVPDLFVGRPIILTGRYQGQLPGQVTVRGTVAGKRHTLAVRIDDDRGDADRSAIASVWARTKIADLANRALTGNAPDLAEEIKSVALEYGLMSAYTAFVAVDSSRRTAGAHGITVPIPVPVPDGVRYETTVPRG